MVLETMWFTTACLGFFPPFPHYFIFFFFPFGDFAIFRGILDFFGGKRGFLAFWRLFRWFYGLLEAF